MKLYVLSFVALIVISGCTKDTDTDASITSNPYYPLVIGKYIDYQISETIYRDGGASIDTITSYLREEIVSEQTSLTGETEYFIDRSTKTSLEAPWIFLESARVLFSNNQVLLKDNNRTFVKLNLPIVTGESWDGNAFFDSNNPIDIGGQSIDYYKGWAANYLSVSGSVNINNTAYNDVLAVELANQENRIELRKASELYAAKIGLISREIKVLDTQCFDGCQNIPWEQKAERGHIYMQHIIDHN